MALKIIRVINPATMNLLQNFLIPTDMYPSVEVMSEELQRVLREFKECCYYSVALDDESEELLMFILAFVQPGTEYAVLFQVWVTKALPQGSTLPHTMFMRFLMWCEANGIKDARVDDDRTPPSILTTWGFSPRKTTYELHVSESVEASLARASGAVVSAVTQTEILPPVDGINQSTEQGDLNNASELHNPGDTNSPAAEHSELVAAAGAEGTTGTVAGCDSELREPERGYSPVASV